MPKKAEIKERKNNSRWDRRLTWRWLYPGVRLKRWLFLLLLSVVVVGVGISGRIAWSAINPGGT